MPLLRPVIIKCTSDDYKKMPRLRPVIIKCTSDDYKKEGQVTVKIKNSIIFCAKWQ